MTGPWGNDWDGVVEDDGTNGALDRSMRTAERIARRMEEETPLAPTAAPREEPEHHRDCRCDFCVATPRVPEARVGGFALIKGERRWVATRVHPDDVEPVPD